MTVQLACSLLAAIYAGKTSDYTTCALRRKLEAFVSGQVPA